MNNKILTSKLKKNVLNFFKEKGFYLSLILFIVMIGMTTVFLTNYNASSLLNYDTQKFVPEESIIMDSEAINKTDFETSKSVASSISESNSINQSSINQGSITETQNTKKEFKRLFFGFIF